MNKREFLLGSCALICTAAPALGTAASSGRPLRRLPGLAESPDLASWQAYLDQTFEVATARGRQRLRLRQVRVDAPRSSSEQFTLVFGADAGAMLAEGTHTLAHATGQRVPVYLAPMQASDSAAPLRWAAHFNLLV